MSLGATYDAAADALYLASRPGVAIAETEELDPRVIVDRDATGQVVGVELLEAARRGIPIGLLVRALGADVTDGQEVGEAALRAVRVAGPGGSDTP